LFALLPLLRVDDDDAALCKICLTSSAADGVFCGVPAAAAAAAETVK
jgi:hypothetical protein